MRQVPNIWREWGGTLIFDLEFTEPPLFSQSFGVRPLGGSLIIHPWNSCWHCLIYPINVPVVGAVTTRLLQRTWEHWGQEICWISQWNRLDVAPVSIIHFYFEEKKVEKEYSFLLFSGVCEISMGKFGSPVFVSFLGLVCLIFSYFSPPSLLALLWKEKLFSSAAFFCPPPFTIFFLLPLHCGLLTSPQSYKSKILEEMLLWEC